jgi:hypothetical protein
MMRTGFAGYSAATVQAAANASANSVNARVIEVSSREESIADVSASVASDPG